MQLSWNQASGILAGLTRPQTFESVRTKPKLCWSRKPRRLLSAMAHTFASCSRGRPERLKNSTASPPVSLPSPSARRMPSCHAASSLKHLSRQHVQFPSMHPHRAGGSNQVWSSARAASTFCRVLRTRKHVTRPRGRLPVSAAWNQVANCFLSSLSIGCATVGDAIAASSIGLWSQSDVRQIVTSASTLSSSLLRSLLCNTRCVQLKLIW